MTNETTPPLDCWEVPDTATMSETREDGQRLAMREEKAARPKPPLYPPPGPTPAALLAIPRDPASGQPLGTPPGPEENPLTIYHTWHAIREARLVLNHELFKAWVSLSLQKKNQVCADLRF